MEILWKRTVSAKFPVNRAKLCGNYAFPQDFHTMKLNEVCAVYKTSETPQSNFKHRRT